MNTVAVDAGHGGGDPGGVAFGYSESMVVLPWAIELGRVLRSRGHRVVLTRDSDVFVGLSERARIANDAGADLFVSLHANASHSAGARGPWSIHAAPSAEGRRIADALQRTLAACMQGDPAAVYPDESPWVDFRRLTVLRRTTMPAVLLELGFMTNAKDLSMMRDPEKRRRTCALLAVAIGEALRVAPPREIPAPSGELAVPTAEPVAPEPPNLETIYAMTPEVLQEVARRQKLDPAKMAEYAAAFEWILQRMDRSGVKHAGAAAALFRFGLRLFG